MSLESWLRLWRVPGIGAVSFKKLLDAFGSAEDALSAGDAQWRDAGLNGRQITARDQDRHPDISPDLDWLQQPGNDLITLDDTRYPSLLATIPDPPPLLFTHGDCSLLQHPQLAVVGSRHPTNSGQQTARAFSAHLAAAGLGITSGLALGIDSAAHEGALKANGITLAVAGTGLDRIYPARNRELAHKIGAQGLLISEFPIGTIASPGNFPRRNRIISGLSLGTLVVEAAIKSGSLITARVANEQGREVFAIPGSIHNPLARGCHRLIRQGAKLVETADDILEELAPLLATMVPQATGEGNDRAKENADEMDPEQLKLLQCVDFDPTPVDIIIARSGLTAETVSSMLLIMELNNLVAAEAGGYYVRVG